MYIGPQEHLEVLVKLVEALHILQDQSLAHPVVPEMVDTIRLRELRELQTPAAAAAVALLTASPLDAEGLE
jgi:hypothetical protein